MKYAYARVSTRKQSRDGNGLYEQIAKLKTVGYDELIVEEFTGSTTKRPFFDKLIQNLKQGDTLIVTKLDRFARSAAEGLSFINSLLARGVHVFILNMGLIDNTPTGRLITNILLAFAEYERDMIIERTQAGKEIARSKNGFRDGRPPIDQKKKILPLTLSSTNIKLIKRLLNLPDFQNPLLLVPFVKLKLISLLRKKFYVTTAKCIIYHGDKNKCK